MHKKIGTVVDEGLILRAKEVARDRRVTLSRIFEDALSEYIARRGPVARKVSSVEISFGALRIPAKLAAEIAGEDMYEAE